MLIRTDWTADGHWVGINIRQPYRVTAGILAFDSVLCLPLSRWRVVLGKREPEKVEEKQITAFLDRCCCLFLTAGHGYNCVCFDFSQHSPHRLSRGRTLFLTLFSTCVVYFDITTVWTAERRWCEKNNALKFEVTRPLDSRRRTVPLLLSYVRLQR